MPATSKVSIQGSDFPTQTKTIGPSKKNKVTFSKMLIADPSLAFELKVDYFPAAEAKPVRELKIYFRLGIESGSYPYGTDISLDVPAGNTLDLSLPACFVIPFTDPDFDNEGANYYYDVKVELYSLVEGDPILLTTTFTGSVPKTDVKKTGDFALKHPNGNPPNFTTPEPLGGNNVTYNDIWFHEQGACYGVKLPAITKDAADPVNLGFWANQDPHHGSTASVRGLVKDGELKFDMSTEPAFLWLPHAPYTVNNVEISSAQLNVEVYKLTNVAQILDPTAHVIFEGVENLNYFSQNLTVSAEEVIIYVKS